MIWKNFREAGNSIEGKIIKLVHRYLYFLEFQKGIAQV